MAALGDMQAFELRAGSYANGELRVVRFHGREALSQPYQFDVELVGEAEESLDVRPLLGADALLMVRSPGGERLVHGMVSRIETLSRRAGQPRYRARIVPKLWRLGLVQHCRHFQGQTAPAIVQNVLDESGITTRVALSGNYAAREMCVQYRESDLAFVSRLLEAEGIFYFFEHSEDGHVLVLADAANVPAPLSDDSRLVFRERGDNPDVDHVFAFESRQTLRTGAVTLGDFDFVRPTLDMAGIAKADTDADLEDYEHPGEHATPADGKRLAKLRLEMHRAQVATADGASVCARLVPGATFDLDEHGNNSLNQRYLVVEVQHHGIEPELVDAEQLEGNPPYRNDLRCMPADLPYRPPLRTPRPVIPGMQTALVVGPGGEEIHTDEHGRIAVQFHWDREKKASCWIRVSQAWAGAGWGALYLPRIGMEVIVRFLEGNPDRPIVVGATYNGANPPPVSLPGDKTKSVLRSASSPGSAGHNELTFEDAAGAEQIYVHAQKDETITVENDKNQTVGGFESLSVKKDRTRDITGQQALHVVLDDAARVDGNQTITVMGKRTVHVDGGHSETIAGSATELVTLARSLSVTLASAESVKLAKALNIGAAYLVDVGAAASLVVGGLRSLNVGGFATESVIGSSSETVEGNRSSKVVLGVNTVAVEHDYKRSVLKNEKLEAKECFLSAVKGPAQLESKKIEITAEELALTLNGEIALIINKSGTLKIFGKKILIEGESGTKLKGKKIHLKGSGSGSKKKGKDVLDPSEATSGPKGKGGNELLSPDDAKGFEGLEYQSRVLKKDMVCYRLHDGGKGAYPLGKWVGKSRPPPGLEGKLRCALDPTWGNAATHVAKIHLPAGTKVFEGAYAAQGAGAYASKGTQLCVALPKALRGKAVGEYLTKIGVKVIP